MKPKPPEISRATSLLWASLAIGLVKSPMQWAYLTARASIAFTGFILALVLDLTLVTADVGLLGLGEIATLGNR